MKTNTCAAEYLRSISIEHNFIQSEDALVLISVFRQEVNETTLCHNVLMSQTQRAHVSEIGYLAGE